MTIDDSTLPALAVVLLCVPSSNLSAETSADVGVMCDGPICFVSKGRLLCSEDG